MPKKIKTKPRLVVFLLATFLGAFGVHNFYVGHTGRGIAQLLLTITFFFFWVTSIWVLIEWVMILLGKFKDKEGNELKEW